MPKQSAWSVGSNSIPRANRRFLPKGVGTAISFPNLAVFCDPIFGHPEASVTIECHDDSVSLATASQLFESFEDLHRRLIKTADAA